jgi:type I restriction enzyme, R subunit
VNTKYYANNRNQSFKQTFYWTDVENKRQTNILNGFTEGFLEPCHISKMICKYIVLNEAYKIPMVLRPYQFYAVEALIKRVADAPAAVVDTHGLAYLQPQPKNGYIWHTTGSGKTLTSFKASQIIMNMPQVHKVVFVVDRKDLDYQTTKEFNSFSKGSIDGTDSTKALVKQFTDDTKLIVTTIQKLNTAISKLKYESKMADLKDKRLIFIFDECHRSQFGETHNRIKAFFNNIQMFGFTGTPIFADNAVKSQGLASIQGKRTTKDLFQDCLHKYVITDAIRDENVLKFSVEYVGRYQRPSVSTMETNIDIEVEDIDTKELMEDERRLEKIADYIITHHNRKTHSREFTGMFCINSVPTLIKYYDILKRKKAEGLHNETHGRASQQEIFNLLSTETTLRSKRELIEKFIKENLPSITDSDEIVSEFDKFWGKEQQAAFTKLVAEEKLSASKTEKLIEDYLFAEREPLRNEVLELLEGEKPSLLQRKKLGDRILKRLMDFVETFINGMSG